MGLEVILLPQSPYTGYPRGCLATRLVMAPVQIGKLKPENFPDLGATEMAQWVVFAV